DLNIVRTTYQALATVLGGIQSLALSCHDEALSLPTEEAQRIAVRTQQIIAYESGVTDSADPLAGSYFIEWLTNELEKGAWEYLHHIEEMGGAVTAIESGYIQREIQEASWAYQRAVDEDKKTIVGVNRFQVEDEEPQMIFRVNPETELSQLKKFRAFKKQRDDAPVRATLKRLDGACRSDEGPS
ncbi:unnamed protein product, partial [marine sediment metagenome]